MTFVAAGLPRGRGWQLAILGLIGFVTSFGAHVVAVSLPVYARDVGVGLAGIGLLIAVYDLAELIAKPVFGYVADKRGRKPTMLLGLAVFSAASLGFLAVDPRLLIFVRLFQGLGAAAFSVISLSLVAERFGESRGQAYGIYNALKGAGYVVSPAIGGAIVWASDFRAIFIACALLGLVALVAALGLPSSARPRGLRIGAGALGAEGVGGAVENDGAVDAFDGLDDDDDDLSPRVLISAFTRRDLLPWYGVIVVNMFLASILFGFLPVYANSLGLNQLAVGGLTTLAALSYLLVQPIAGRLADRVDPARTVTLGLLIGAVGVTTLPFSTGLMLPLLIVVAGAGVGTVWTNTDTLISRLAESSSLGAGIGAAGSFKEIGDMLGPLAVGLLAQAFGLRAGFAICGVAALVACLAVTRRRSSFS